MHTMPEGSVVYHASSRQGSPVPRRQLGTLPANQRSYSRMSSKGGFGDESPLMSPLPYYPRHRSVTFAEGQSGAREERPNYNATYSASAPVSPARQHSPPPVSILKTSSFFPDEEESGAVPGVQVAAAATATSANSRGKDALRSSPVPPRGRSNSRQRLAARRREAQLHHSFYDDSFVEEFVLSAKTELEKEEAEQRRVQEQLRAEQEKAKRAERRVSEAAEKINALQHAKEVLMAATVRRHTSVTPSPPRAHTDKSKRNSSLLRELEEDPDPAVQEALKELSRQSQMRHRQQQQQHQQQQRRRSMPIVFEDALAESSTEDADGAEDDVDDDEARKRARLEKIVSTVLSRKGKSKSKRSVLVIDWSDLDSDNAEPNNDEEDAEAEELNRLVGVKRQRSRQAKSRSVALAPEATLVASKAPRKPSVRRAASSHRRNASMVPDLGDSLLFETEEEQPILLPRRQHQRPAQTRSISHIDMEDDNAVLESEVSMERIARRPPRATRAPANQRHRKPAVAAAAPPPRAPAGRGPSSAYASAGAGRGRRALPTMEEKEQEAEDALTTPAPAPRSRRPAAPRADPNDPMAVFFEAAFPSPSKFDEMMMQAGGLPETRRGGGGGGRGQGRQPNLVLPSSIGRRR
jgi:hypothetical protein